jgi:hypothetical protein
MYNINGLLSTSFNDIDLAINFTINIGSNISCISKKFMIENKNDFKPILVDTDVPITLISGCVYYAPLFLFDVSVDKKIKQSIMAPIGTIENCLGTDVLLNYNLTFKDGKFYID